MSTARSVTEIGLFARCAKPFRISVRSNVICLACLPTLNQTMPAAKTADKKASTETLYASMLNSIADFRESQLIHSYSMDRLCRLPPRAHKDKLGITGSYSSLARKVNLCPSEDTSRPDSKHAKTGWRRS